jgi:hypothetical protein
MPRLAVVIVSWNVRELLASCLRSLFDDLARSDVRASVWVVDNASRDGTPELVGSAFPSVNLIASDENLGFAAGNNLALKAMAQDPRTATRESVVWLLNPDTEVQPGATAALLSGCTRMAPSNRALFASQGCGSWLLSCFPCPPASMTPPSTAVTRATSTTETGPSPSTTRWGPP